MENEIINTHDKFFKELFSKKAEVTEFIQKSISKEIVNKLNLESLQLDNSEYISKNLKQSFSDIVYNCNYLGQTNIKICFLFEHKSYPEKHIHFQLLEYITGIWKLQLKQKQVLSPVIPVIFYHGKAKWEKVDFYNYFSEIDSELQKFIPKFDYELIDITRFSDKEINSIYKSIELKTSLLLLKYIFTHNFLEKLNIIFSDIDKVFYTENGENFVKKVSTYIFYNSDFNFNKILDKMRTISPRANENFESTAIQLIKQGRQEGRQEGELIGIEKVAIQLIKEKFDNLLISKATGLSFDHINKLREELATYE